MKWAMIGVTLILNSCAYVDQCDSLEHGELRINVPPKPDQRSLPNMCRPLYNVGKSEEWFDCMGVGLK